jgi:hypothetical protein
MSLIIPVPTGDYSNSRNEAIENNSEIVRSSRGKLNSTVNRKEIIKQ